MPTITLSVNGAERRLDVAEGESLLEALRGRGKLSFELGETPRSHHRGGRPG